MTILTNEVKKEEVLVSETTSKEYVADQILGRGGFGYVVRCLDRSDGKSVAIKIQRTEEDAYAAKAELDLLLKIKNIEDGNKYLIKVLDFFLYKEKLCIVLEEMDLSLDDYIYKTTAERNLSFTEIRIILRGILMGLAKLKQMDIIHADIKPDNIMLKNCGTISALRAKIIDFGVAHLSNNQEDDPFIQPLHYRSPEVIMYCLPYSASIDVWSAGCILGELLIKRSLYPGKCEYDQLRYIIENQGLPPKTMLRKGLRSHLFFNKGRCVKLKNAKNFLETLVNEYDGHDGIEEITENMVIYDRFELHRLKTIANFSRPPVRTFAESKERQEVVDLVEALLNLDPHERISAEKAAMHPFFSFAADTECNIIIRDNT